MSPLGSPHPGKSSALLRFLKDSATLRRKRISAYGPGEKLLWLFEVPEDRSGCRSAFFAANPEENPDLWLEVCKKRMPIRPSVPDMLKDWTRPEELEQADQEPELIPEITVIVEKRVPDPKAPPEEGRTVVERVAEVRRLVDHPEVEDAWLDYLVSQWEPWAQAMRSWQNIQRVYEDVDFMRRRLEEAEERYELILAIGLLQWRDPAGVAVKRHILTAPAEISFDASRGILMVGPTASFQDFRIELDMLELQNQPRLEGTDLEEYLEELDVQGWDRAKVGRILRVIGNRASPNAQVDESTLKPLEHTDEVFRVVYAPAIVLRERRPTAYEELINRFLQDVDSEPLITTTEPWERFICEGEQSPGGGGVDNLGEKPHVDPAGSRLYFPLPTNDEQRKIAERLKVHPYVLVKGPPGTGKSHTIANLICHLLASGERVLVTAHAPKALTVLRELLPGDIRNLCVTAFGSTREDQRLLEDSVRGILSRKNEWKGELWAQGEIGRQEGELCRLEDRRARVERDLRQCREAETYAHTRPGGYEGTAAQIARQVKHNSDMYSWFPELSDGNNGCPLQPDEVAFLSEINGYLNEGKVNELGLDIGNISLPDPIVFEQAIEKIKAAVLAAEMAQKGLLKEEIDTLRPLSSDTLDRCRSFIMQIDEYITRAHRILGDSAIEIVKDLLVGRETRWNRLAKVVATPLESIKALNEKIGTSRIDTPNNIENSNLLADVRLRLNHFMNAGRRGWRYLAPRVVRETRYIEEYCRVDGRVVRESSLLETLEAFLQLKESLEQFYRIWPIPLSFDYHLDPRRAAHEACDLAGELDQLLSLFKDRDPNALDVVPTGRRIALVESVERAKWLSLIKAETAIRQAHQEQDVFDGWLRSIRSLSCTTVHPVVNELAQAIEQRDSAKWKISWEKRESFSSEKDAFCRYKKLLDTILKSCPDLEALLTSAQGKPEWKDPLRGLEKAWMWSAARAWLRSVSDGGIYRSLEEEHFKLQDKIEKNIEEQAAIKAWQAFFSRLDDKTEQYLTAWTKAIARIGKGTGKYAYRYRRIAREYLTACIPKIPAWVMPLHKLWETTEPTAGAFDTLIIDEASQAGIESLVLFLLAKRVIVVGDDKQNSPEAVGVLEDDIARLARDYLKEFRFRALFRPDTSLFDHAERAFGNMISLREHFRCVPEIIRFSNELCYTDAPLIPLRQPPPNRLQPLRTTFVEGGSCAGEGQRITNRAEADEVVRAIQECLDDESYEGKTMGVIILQGHAQAELIEKRIAETLEPSVREERKLRCGGPATFQGDQRDLIFLSLVVAPNHNYRALSGLSDQRRFNVAMSRARDQVWLFHSVRQDELSREDLRWRLMNFFSHQGTLDGIYEELDRLEQEVRHKRRVHGEQPDPYESWFEVDIALELLRNNYRIRCQVDVAGYRIDLVVEGQDNRLAVECDGDAWHGPDRYDQDMARQRQLERAGWTFIRIRESEYYADRPDAVTRILEACDELGIRRQGEEQVAADIEESPPIADFAVGAGPTKRIIQSDFIAYKQSCLPRLIETPTIESGPFSGYSEECGYADPREASLSNIKEILRQIIEKEGPLTKSSTFRLYVQGCPLLHRAGKAIRSILNKALWSIQKAGEIIIEDELGDRSLDSQVVRIFGTPKVKERPAGQRDLLEIPPSELLLMLDRLQASSPSAFQNDETLIRALLQHYGFNRLTEVRRRHLERIIELHRQQRSGS